MAKSKKSTLLHYKNHARRRVIGDLVWEAANDWTTAVDDPALVEALLQEPEFEVVADVEPTNNDAE